MRALLWARYLIGWNAVDGKDARTLDQPQENPSIPTNPDVPTSPSTNLTTPAEDPSIPAKNPNSPAQKPIITPENPIINQPTSSETSQPRSQPTKPSSPAQKPTSLEEPRVNRGEEVGNEATTKGNNQKVHPPQKKVPVNPKPSPPVQRKALPLEEKVLSLVTNTFEVKKDMEKSIRYAAVTVTKVIIPFILSLENSEDYLEVVIKKCYDYHPDVILYIICEWLGDPKDSEMCLDKFFQCYKGVDSSPITLQDIRKGEAFFCLKDHFYSQTIIGPTTKQPPPQQHEEFLMSLLAVKKGNLIEFLENTPNDLFLTYMSIIYNIIKYISKNLPREEFAPVWFSFLHKVNSLPEFGSRFFWLQNSDRNTFIHPLYISSNIKNMKKFAKNLQNRFTHSPEDINHNMANPLYHNQTISKVTFISTFYSAGQPVYLELEGSSSTSVIAKLGNIIQDHFFQLLFDVLNELWKKIDTACQPIIYTYKCIPLTSKLGLIEMVSNSVTFRDFFWERDNISNMDTFLRSLAGSVLGSYVFGIRDRHERNVIIKDKCMVYNVDFECLWNRGSIQGPSTVSMKNIRKILNQDDWLIFRKTLEAGFNELASHKQFLLSLALAAFRMYVEDESMIKMCINSSLSNSGWVKLLKEVEYKTSPNYSPTSSEEY